MYKCKHAGGVPGLLEDITELMGLADVEAAAKSRHQDYGTFRKTPHYDPYGIGLRKALGGDDDEGHEPSPHADVKAAHHEKMAELHAKIADSHHSMASHYSSGAQGAHVGDDDGETDATPFEETDEPSDAELVKLRAAAEAGSVEARLMMHEIGVQAVRNCGRQVGDPSQEAYRKLLAREFGRSR